MIKLNKIGFIILSLVWSVSYYLKHINHIVSQLVVDYFITFGYCIGTALITIYYGKKEQDKIKLEFEKLFKDEGGLNDFAVFSTPTK